MRRAILEQRVPWAHALRRALRMRRVAGDAHGALLLPVAGGAGGLLAADEFDRLASLLDPNAVVPDGHSMRHHLERRQARRSALLFVPDRATGMRFAGLWRLDLSRIRVVDVEHPPRDVIANSLAEKRVVRDGSRPWHAA